MLQYFKGTHSREEIMETMPSYDKSVCHRYVTLMVLLKPSLELMVDTFNWVLPLLQWRHLPSLSCSSISSMAKWLHPPPRITTEAASQTRARICKPFKEPRNRFLGPERKSYLSYRPAMLHRLAASIPRNWFLCFLNVYKYGLRE